MHRVRTAAFGRSQVEGEKKGIREEKKNQHNSTETCFLMRKLRTFEKSITIYYSNFLTWKINGL